MKKFFKRFITCSLAACLLAVTAFAGACKNDDGNKDDPGKVDPPPIVDDDHLDPTKYGYTITVLYPDNTPVKGTDGPNSRQKVGVQLVDSNGKDINGAYSELSDAGKAVINYKVSGEFLIDILNCPRGFDYKDTVTTVAGRGDYTVKLSAEKVDYTINVKLPDDTPASGVGVIIKKNGVIVQEKTTGADGKVVIENVDAGTYDVEFKNLPEGVSYLPTQLTAKTTTLNVNLISLKELKLDTVMSEEKLNEWDELANYYAQDDGDNDLIRFNRNADCYDFKTDFIAEGKKVYYYFTADKTGSYRLISKGKYYVVEIFISNFDEVYHTIISEHESTNTCEMVEIDLKEGDICYFAYSIPERSNGTIDGKPDDHELSGTREFMIAKPFGETKTHEVYGPGEYTINFETDTAVLIFYTPENANPGNPLPDEGGIFEIRSHTTLYDVKIEFYTYINNKDRAPDEMEDDISSTDKNFLFTIKLPPSFAGNIYYFRIIIKGSLDGSEVEYPTQVPITITRTGDAEENMSPTEYKHATTREKYPDQDGKEFHFLLGNNSSIREEDFNIEAKNGGYYVNIDGTEYELVIAISRKLCSLPYSFTTIEYMGGGDRGGSGGGDGPDDELPSVPSDTKQNNYLTLYEDSTLGEDKSNPKYNYAPFIEEYALLCNKDGVYKLNSELKEFAEMYYNQHAQDFIYGLSLDECCWLIACGYYA